MSILIKGADMPDKCGQCPCFHHEYPMYCQATKESSNKTPDAPYGMPRPDWCPLVEVPENHGKLLDYNALSELVKEDFGYFLARLDLKVPPTVIEAEREEHERTDKGHEYA